MIRPGEPNDYAAEILFYLPWIDDPREPKIGHVFVLGEVRIKLSPSSPWINVALGRIVERGEGWYAIRLTAAQRAAATVVAYEAVCADAQPDRGTETIGELSGDIPEGGAGILPFFLADENDPISGPPIEGHVFVHGEVKLSLPDDAFGNVAPADIVEFGGGMYGVQLAGTKTAKRGKAIVVANVTGAQRFSGHRTILGDGALVPSEPPPLPVPSFAELEHGVRRVGGDLALVWSNATGADLALVDADLATDPGLMTAVELSLLTDRRAEPDDKPPSGDPDDRRGWWADEFAAIAGDRIGSRLWLLDRAKRTKETELRAKEYVLEALGWMLEDRVVERIDVTTEATNRALLIAVELQRPGRDPVAYRFAHTWNHMQETV